MRPGQVAPTRRWATVSRGGSRGFDDHGCCFHDCDGQLPPGSRPSCDRFTAHQRHHRERAALHLDLAMTLSVITLVTRPTRRLRAERPTPSGSGAAFAWRARTRPARRRDDFAVDLGPLHGRLPLDPAAHGVIADAEQSGGVFDPDGRQVRPLACRAAPYFCLYTRRVHVGHVRTTLIIAAGAGHRSSAPGVCATGQVWSKSIDVSRAATGYG